MYAMCRKIFILFLALGFVLASPIAHNQEDTSNEISAATKVNDVADNDIEKTEQDCGKEDESSDCSNSSEENTPVDNNTNLQTGREIPSGYLQPSSLPSYQSYQQYPYIESLGIGVSNHRGVLFPYAHSKFLASYNPGYTVNSLPPVVSTYIHGLVPNEEVQRSRYELDVLNLRNSVYLPAVVRPARMLRTAEEELLAQLRHDAIMSNILPTMQVPFARHAAAPVNYGALGHSVGASGLSIGAAGSSLGLSNSGMTALFPNAGSLDSPQPFLFSCTPKIIQGRLRSAYPNLAVQAASPAVSGYRDESEKSKSSEKHNTPTKVDLVVKSKKQDK